MDFLGLVVDAHPDVDLHVICDNYATHKHGRMTAWLAVNPRVTMHFTPTSYSWLSMVEVFVGIITKQAIRRGSFHSVDDLEAMIRTYIASYNERPTPFIWTNTAEHLIGEINRKRTIDTRHERSLGVRTSVFVLIFQAAFPRRARSMLASRWLSMVRRALRSSMGAGGWAAVQSGVGS